MAARPWFLAGLIALAGAPAWAAPAPSGLDFLGARLGMTLKDWRAVPLPPGAGDAAAICTDQDKTVRIPGYALSARDVRDGVVVCSYRARFGQDVLNHPVQIDPNFHANRLAYVFRRGRLDEMRFTASVDAYDDIRKVLGLRGHGGGPRDPSQGLRRTRTWRSQGAVVTIGPGPNPTEIGVRLRRG